MQKKYSLRAALFFFTLVVLILLGSKCFAANAITGYTATPDDALHYEQASVDTDPGVNGYGCNPVSARYTAGWNAEEIWFYIAQITDGTITLQQAYCPDSDCSSATWVFHSEYTSTVDGSEFVIHSSGDNVFWKAFVLDNDQGTGTSIFGIRWHKTN
jgi:hypothetical protein